jgi:type IV secretory pathway VirB2 component (pilin)
MKKIYKVLPFLMLLPSAVYAQTPPRLDNGTIQAMVDRVLSYLFPIAGVISVIFVIIGGYMWMTSGGDPARVKQAQGTLTWALLGLGFVLLSVAILEIVTKFIS